MHIHWWDFPPYVMKPMAVLAFIIYLLGLPTYAATVPVTVPDPAVPKLQELCAAIQAEIKAKTFTNSECGTYLVRVGARVKARQLKRAELQDQADTLIVDGENTEMTTFDADFPQQYVEAVCGDGDTDAITGEECDDGNTEAGDGCSATCTNE